MNHETRYVFIKTHKNGLQNPFSKRFSYWPLWGCAGDWVEMVSKCIVGLLWGTNFQHGGKFVPQSSPTMHFDNHLDPVSQPTSKWRIEKYIDSLILLSSCTCARVHFHLLLSIVKLTRFNDKFSLRQILGSSLWKKKKRMHEYCPQFSWFAYSCILKYAELRQL